MLPANFGTCLTPSTAHVVRDTVYMDGGRMWWLPGLSNGTYGAVESDRTYPPSP